MTTQEQSINNALANIPWDVQFKRIDTDTFVKIDDEGGEKFDSEEVVWWFEKQEEEQWMRDRSEME